MRHNTLKYAMFALIASFALACSDEEEHAHEEETPEAEACEHLQEGPAVAITALADPDGALPRGDEPHKRIDVTLADLDAQKGGYIAYEAAEAGEYLFFVNQTLTFKVMDAEGTEVALENSVTGSDLCTDIAVTHTVDLEVGTYTLMFGPTDLTEVSFVAEHDEAH